MLSRRIAVAAVAACGVGFVVGRLPLSPSAVPQTPWVSSASPALTSVPPPSATSSTSPPISGPDRQALKQRELDGPRDRRDAAFLYEGHTALAKEDALRSIKELDEVKLGDGTRMIRLRTLLTDVSLLPDTLVAFSQVADPRVPDLLHELCTQGDRAGRATLLSCDLMNLADVAARRTPALQRLMDLEAASSCEAVTHQIAHSRQLLDERALPTLSRLDKLTGCGPKRTEDCFACLRTVEKTRELAAFRVELAGRRFRPAWRAAR